MKVKISVISIVGLILVLGACVPLSTTNTTEADKIQLLETQNALLLQQNQSLMTQKEQNTPTQENSESVLSTSVPQPKPTEGVSIQEVTAVLETLPTDPVPAGQPISYGGWSLTVSQELDIYYGGISPRFYLQNLTDKARIFRFTNESISISDDLGNEYKHVIKYDFYDYCEEYLYVAKNLEVESQRKVEIGANEYHDCDNSDGIGKYIGPIPTGAKQLFVKLSDFGPFSGVTFVITL
jgi:type II secretory pathway pseudopilin PulG